MNICVRSAVAFLFALFLTSCRSETMPGGALERAPQNAAGMFSTDDLRDKRIGVLMGSVYDRFASKTYPQATVLHFDSQSDLQLAVISGKVDAGLGDENGIVEVLRTNNDLAMFGDPLLTLPLGVGFRKGNTE